jgi:hypothetical protein
MKAVSIKNFGKSKREGLFKTKNILLFSENIVLSIWTTVSGFSAEAAMPTKETSTFGNWEVISKKEGSGYTNLLTERMKVPGGWLIRSTASCVTQGPSVCQTFVADSGAA